MATTTITITTTIQLQKLQLQLLEQLQLQQNPLTSDKFEHILCKFDSYIFFHLIVTLFFISYLSTNRFSSLKLFYNLTFYLKFIFLYVVLLFEIGELLDQNKFFFSILFIFIVYEVGVKRPGLALFMFMLEAGQ